MISPEQKTKLIDLMREVDADVAKFLQYLGVAYLDVLPATKFQSAVDALEKKRRTL